jgi:uncharacterized membrane protein
MARTSFRFALTLLALPLSISLAVACGGGDDEGGGPTGATCPSGSTLTYDSFGRDFMEDYCTRCHSSELTGADRKGAPDDHNFDSLQGVLEAADHIDEYAGKGPDSTNTFMPPGAPRPSDDDRAKLAEWLACEVANQ